MKNFAEFGIKVPEILLPKDKDLSSWSVIACDQYTQDQNYWDKVSNAAGNKPSTLNIILPEVYLGSKDRPERIEKIRQTMKSYLKDGVFDQKESEFIYVERKTAYGRVRKGLVVAIDLETYEWKPMSKALIRATEATIVERIPPRKEIRKNAPVESPHIMLLVNDKDHCLVEGTGTIVKSDAPIYDGDLMLNSGHITGWAVKSEKAIDAVEQALLKLKKQNTDKDGNTFMFAVGDGNHSLATAKAVWDEYKAENNVTDGNVRYALVEIVNIYDSGLTFEPIHRVFLNADSTENAFDSLKGFIKENLKGNESLCSSFEELDKKVKASKASFGFVCTKQGKTSYVLVDTPVTELAVSRFQPLADQWVKDVNQKGSKIEIDYIHGSDEVLRLGKKEGNVTVLLPPIAKDSFFETINTTGPLPRKSFSMGEASEKRFYLECRELFN